MRFRTRSYLFVPGDRPERFSKAAACGADHVVLDLEDAVSPASKDAARMSIAEALSDGGLKACIRINATSTSWFTEDIRLLSLPGVASVMLPKAEGATDVAAVHAACGTGVVVVPLIETARGLAAAQQVAASPGVLQLAFGSVDYQRDLSIEGDGDELLHARSQLVFASRLAGVMAPIDGVTLAVKDTAQVGEDALRARRLGFAGKLCIHPSQVAAVNEAFMPDARRIAWARGVLEASASTTAGALTYEGQLVDKPVIDRARGVLQLADA